MMVDDLTPTQLRIARLKERFDQFKKERKVKGIKAELDEFHADEERAVRLEAEASRKERNLKASKRVEAATCRLQSARTGREKLQQSRKCSTGTGIGNILWPKEKPVKGQKTARSEVASVLWPPAKTPRKKGKKGDSFLDGLF